MIIFADNVVSVVDDLGSDDISSEDSSVAEDLVTQDSSASVDSSVPEDLATEGTSVPEDLAAEDTSVLDQSSATGETQQSSTPTIINDIVVPDNSYSKYCFFFLMLLFALFVGRSFRKGV